MAPDKKSKVNKEVDQLLSAGFIKPVEYPRWVLNTLVVQNKNEHIRVCFDFMKFNKGYTMNHFLLCQVNYLVDVIVGYQRLSFLNAFLGTRCHLMSNSYLYELHN